MSTLEIKDLWVEVEGITILKGVNITINSNEFHVIMGPNGNGKSTLVQTLMGHHKYTVVKGSATLDGVELLDKSVDERSRMGLFLGMQYPSEIPGVSNAEFIKSAINARLKEGENLSLFKYIKELDKASNDLRMPDNLANRYINVGFSGGEKKRNEVLQMKMLKPKFALLDEIDSGLDVDALKIVGENISAMKSKTYGAIIITHYERFLDYLPIDRVHVLIDGQIVCHGGRELIQRIDSEGYDWVKVTYGVGLDVADRVTTPLGTCAVADITRGKK